MTESNIVTASDLNSGDTATFWFKLLGTNEEMSISGMVVGNGGDSQGRIIAIDISNGQGHAVVVPIFGHFIATDIVKSQK